MDRKFRKYQILSRYYIDLNSDPTVWTRMMTLHRKNNHDSHHAALPWGELTTATVGSVLFGGVFSLFGILLAVGNFPNHHELPREPTIRQQFRFNGRYAWNRIKSQGTWVRIGVAFAFCDWMLMHHWAPEMPSRHQYLSSIVAGAAFAATKGPWAASVSAFGFGVFTTLFVVGSKFIDMGSLFGGQFDDIDATKMPGAPPLPPKENILLPRDQRVELRTEKRIRHQQMTNQQMMQAQGGMGMGAQPMGPEPSPI